MSKFVFISDDCRNDCRKHDLESRVISFRDRIEKYQTAGSVDFYPPPFQKKNIGRKGRLIIEERLDGDDVIYIFLRLFIRGSKEYDVFMHLANSNQATSLIKKHGPTKSKLESWLGNRKAEDPPCPLQEPSDTEYLYLVSHGETTDSPEATILESREWVQAIKSEVRLELRIRYGDLLEQLIVDLDTAAESTIIREDDDPEFGILYKYYPQSRILFAIAPLQGTRREEELRTTYSRFLEEDQIDRASLLQHGVRSYPSLIALDSDLWLDTQESMDANLALSPEEIDILDSVSGRGEYAAERCFPLFINGRPGSGKSTVLLYLFADYLLFHLSNLNNRSDTLSKPPLYLTYSETLLTEAKRIVTDILRCDFKKNQGERGLLDDESVIQEMNNSFQYFRKYLLDILPETEKKKFDAKDYFDFPSFRSFLQGVIGQDPKASLRSLSPEISWHVIRTYIKGMRQEDGGYLVPEDYESLPEKRKTVSDETFRAVHDSVWDRYYKPLCEEGKWDDQDLARKVLDLSANGEIMISNRPGVFCDEAQDFTNLELELIFRSCLFSNRSLQPHLLSQIPFAFAGDPFQTLNPTGFNWDITQASFHDSIVRQLDSARRTKLEFNYQELAFNYRSAKPIVQFCNLVQLMRGRGLGLKSLKPQVTWQVQEASDPRYFVDQDASAVQALQNDRGLVIIVPCQEGEEEQYVKGDPLLSRIAWDSDTKTISRNVLSPMRAKGLQFQRVVLYKFGEYALLHYGETLQPFLDGELASHPRRDSLPIEYFINRLYVAASRPRQKLLIVDTDSGINRFWDFATNPDFDTLIASYSSGNTWQASDLTKILPGESASWQEDKDEPRQLAKDFMQAGMATRDPYQMERARQNFEANNDIEDALEATALKYLYEDKQRLAGDCYVKLKKYDDAIEMYWQAGAFEQIQAVSASGKLDHDPRCRAAAFVTGDQDLRSAELFLADILRAAKSGDHLSMITDPKWPEILDRVIISASGHLKEGATNDAKKIIAYLNQLEQVGVSVTSSHEFTHLAAIAADYPLARRVWDETEAGSEEMPEWMARVFAYTERYPANLPHWAALGEFEEVLKAYESKANQELTPNQLEIILTAYLERHDLDGALSLARMTNDQANLKLVLLTAAARGMEVAANRAAETVLDQLASSSSWIDAVDFATTTDAPKLQISASALGQVRIRTSILSKRLLGHIARSKSLAEEDNQIRSRVARFVRRVGIPDSMEFDNGREVVLVGFALERAEPKLVSVLKFYEHLLDSDNNEIRAFVRRRWLATKLRQSQLRSDRSERHANELRDRAKKWNLDVPADTETRVSLPALVSYDDHSFGHENESRSVYDDAIRQAREVPLTTLQTPAGSEDQEARGPIDVATTDKSLNANASSELPEEPSAIDINQGSYEAHSTNADRSFRFVVGTDVWDGTIIPQHRAVELEEVKTQSKVTVLATLAQVRDTFGTLDLVCDGSQWRAAVWGVSFSFHSYDDMVSVTIRHDALDHPLISILL